MRLTSMGPANSGISSLDCQLTTLKEINEGYVGTGKAVDSTDPIMPVHTHLL